jgi:non-structural maintenance of chromosomes element 1
MVQAVNAQIAPLDYEIRSTRDQNDKTLTYALVNTTSDDLTQLATTFTADEISYIKRLLDTMFDENNTRVREVMAVKQMRATQLARVAARNNRQSQAADADIENIQAGASTKSITQSDADRVLSQLVAQGFLRLSTARYYSLAPRALMELRTYLKETYNDPPAEDDEEDVETVIRIRDCGGCREIVTVGLRCNNQACAIRFHDGCANQYFRGQQGSRPQCPTCKTEWKGNSYVGERADRIQPRNGNSGRRSRAQEEVDEDDED